MYTTAKLTQGDILQSHLDAESGVELRLFKTSQGYALGVWDLDEKAYYPGMIVYPYELDNALEEAIAYFNKSIIYDKKGTNDEM